ncbi:hypothetical protein LXL04_016360 [Taraxacum kok-saghyz]
MAAAAASFAFSRLVTSATKPHLNSASTSLLPPNHRSLNFSSSISPLCIKSLRLTLHNPIKYSTTPKITATISVRDKLPDTTISYFDSDGKLQTTTISDFTKSKKAVLFAVPGAFTPTCSQKHLPVS